MKFPYPLVSETQLLNIHMFHLLILHFYLPISKLRLRHRTLCSASYVKWISRSWIKFVLVCGSHRQCQAIRARQQRAGARMTFLKRPLACTCMYTRVSTWLLSLPLFGVETITLQGYGTRAGAARSDTTCTFAFHEVARTEKEMRKRKEQAARGQRRMDDAGARIRGAQPRGKGNCGRRGGGWAATSTPVWASTEGWVKRVYHLFTTRPQTADKNINVER